jgi:cytidylate kinase
MAVVTISRQAGGNGILVGQTLAKNLGYSYVDKEKIGSIMREYGFSEFDKVYDSKPTVWDSLESHRTQTLSFLQEVETAVAAHGNVVLAGRGGFALLREYDDVLNVRIKAPRAFRIEQLIQRKGWSRVEAENYVQKNDELRKSFVENYVRISYTDTTYFDIILDSSLVPPHHCVEVLVEATKSLEKRTTSFSVKGVAVNPVLADFVRQVLEA